MGEDMQDHRKLRVWHRAQETCLEVYLFSADFPLEERYGVTAQLRKAAVSVGSNIAEGSRRTSKTDKARIFNIAESEAAEAMSVLDLAERLCYGDKGEAARLVRTYDTLLAMIESLRQSALAGTPEPSTGDENCQP
jgi:four helix bundle protein